MSTKHTPGPWVCKPTVYGDCYSIIAADGSAIGRVHLWGDGSESVQAEAKANARLIAAAPELLEALNSARYLLSGVEGISRNNLENLASEEIEAIDRVLAKATGGTP